MQKIIVVYDACVLYSAPLRDLLMHLAMINLYQAKWTNEIHDEWIRNVLANRPNLKRSQLERTRDLMNKHILDCLVEEYEHLIPALTLPDAGDRHVLAAAIHSSASLIITYNLKDFPAKSLKRYGITAQHPDVFLSSLIEIDPDAVCSAIRRLRATLKNPSMPVDQYLLVLENQSLASTVKKLAMLAELL